MKLEIGNKSYESGKIVRKKYDIYSEVRDKLEKHQSYTSEDLDDMVNVLVEVYDNQFTADDINNNFDVSEIIFAFMQFDIEVADKVNSKVEGAKKKIIKNKKFKR